MLPEKRFTTRKAGAINASQLPSLVGRVREDKTINNPFVCSNNLNINMSLPTESKAARTPLSRREFEIGIAKRLEEFVNFREGGSMKFRDK